MYGRRRRWLTVDGVNGNRIQSISARNRNDGRVVDKNTVEEGVAGLADGGGYKWAICLPDRFYNLITSHTHSRD